MLLLRHVHTPWKPSREAIEVVQPTRRRSTPPVNLDAADLELRCARTLRAIVSDVTLAISGVGTDTNRFSAQKCLMWLSTNADTVAPVLDESDILDIQALHTQLEHHHGYTTRDDAAATTMARRRQQLGMQPDHTDTASTLARMARKLGYPVTKSTINRWGASGVIPRVKIDGKTYHYHLADVLEQLQEDKDDNQCQKAA